MNYKKKKKGIASLFKKKVNPKDHPEPKPIKKTTKKTTQKKNPSKPVKPIINKSIKLTPKEELFVKYYFTTKFNGTQAAIKAGYSKNSACSIASQNLLKLHIQNAIQKEKIKIRERTELTQDVVINEIKKVALSDIKDYINIGPKGIKIKDLIDVDTAALNSSTMNISDKGIRIDIKMHNKVQALEMLGRYFGSFNESNKFEVDMNNLKINFANTDFKKKDGE